MAGLVVPVPSLAIERSRPGSDVRPGGVLQQWHDNDGRLIAVGGRDADGWWMQWPGLATFRFGDSGDVRVETHRPGRDLEVQDVFARGVVPVVLLARGFEALHASAVQDDSGIIGLCGTSGTGKSTLAFALASEGLQHFADDTLLYSVLGGSAIGSRIPFPVRVDRPARDAAGRGPVPVGDKSFMSSDLRGFRNCDPRLQAVSSAPVRLIYLLRRDSTLDPRTPRFSTVPPARRFEALLAHAHPFDMGEPERRAAFLASVLALARTTTLCECSFAPALEELPTLAAVIRQHARLQ
jgi:hypothetical protein